MKISKDYIKFIKFLSAILILVGVYYLGYGVGHDNLKLVDGYKPKIMGINDDKPKDVDFSMFWDAWNLVKTQYVNKDTDNQKMVYGSISGMVSSLGDPFTIFMTPEESKNLTEDLQGEFGGIGVEVSTKEGALIVVAPIDGTPAKAAGIRSKDIITKIDGKEVGQMSYAEAINKIRGKKGTNVTLTILHDGDKETQDIVITRDTIKNESVKTEIKDGNIMYIRISQFGADTFDLVNKAADEVQSKNIKKVIVDVRDDPGGYLTGCIDITSLFIPEGVVVKERDRNGQVTESKTTHLQRFNDAKVVVLTNGGSASASEIFSGALQDTKRGVLIGEKTYGKGSVQTMQELNDGSEVKLTIAKWLTPNNREIDKLGIEPDIKVELSKDDIANNNDVQLQKAIEEVNK